MHRKSSWLRPVLAVMLLTSLLLLVSGRAVAAEPPPAITDISPTSAALGATLVIYINGENFAEGAEVYFSGIGISITSVSFFNTNQIEVRIAIYDDAPPGPVHLTVANPDGQSYTLENGFTIIEATTAVPSPIITGLDPNSAERGDTFVTYIIGENFVEGAKVYFSGIGVSITAVTLGSNSEIVAHIAIAENAPLGPRDVTVTNPDDQGYTLKGGFSITMVPELPPIITSIHPDRGGQGKEVDISILGENFGEPIELDFSGAGITIISGGIISSGEIVVRIAIAEDAPSSPRDVIIVNPDGQDYTLTGGFIIVEAVLPPTITGLSPDSAEPGETLLVSIIGENFAEGAEVTFSGTGISVTSVSFVSANEIRVGAAFAEDALPSPRHVTVTNPDGQGGGLANGFTVLPLRLPPPSISRVKPQLVVEQEQTIEFSIIGTGFEAETEVSLVPSAGIAITSAEFVSSAELKVAVLIAPDATTGPRDLTVANRDNQSSTFEGAFTVTSTPLSVFPREIVSIPAVLAGFAVYFFLTQRKGALVAVRAAGVKVDLEVLRRKPHK